jgi:hypothetical protein
MSTDLTLFIPGRTGVFVWLVELFHQVVHIIIQDIIICV